MAQLLPLIDNIHGSGKLTADRQWLLVPSNTKQRRRGWRVHSRMSIKSFAPVWPAPVFDSPEDAVAWLSRETLFNARPFRRDEHTNEYQSACSLYRFENISNAGWEIELVLDRLELPEMGSLQRRILENSFEDWRRSAGLDRLYPLMDDAVEALHCALQLYPFVVPAA